MSLELIRAKPKTKMDYQKALAILAYGPWIEQMDDDSRDAVRWFVQRAEKKEQATLKHSDSPFKDA